MNPGAEAVRPVQRTFGAFIAPQKIVRGGVGLGLSIAQRIATRHGGEILAESTLGAGSVLHVLLHDSAD